MRVKLAAAAFFLLLLCAHAPGDPDRLLGQPLSLFRDGEYCWSGYLLFALLLLIGLLYTAALWQCQREGEAAVSGVAVLLLAVVAVTPSWGSLHLLCSLLLLLLLFAFYALLLRRAGSPLLLAHLAVPAALALATRFHSYGVWQKGFILYFVAAIVVHHHLLAGRPAGHPPPGGDRGRSGRGQPIRPRKVYVLAAGRDWARRRPARPAGAS